ncbi:MAG: rhomboid family intramembrane serine protease [Deltaproteobacteria bacterium]|nr:rhomboid family intramembrane serine protease [Deltaproteobacteria bacterium]
MGLNLNNILILFVMASTLKTIYYIFKIGIKRTISWLVPTIIFLIVLAALLLYKQQICGYIAGGLWLMFFVLPYLLARLINRLINKMKYLRVAYLLLIIAFLLHPSRQIREYFYILKVLNLKKSGRTEEADALLKKAQDKSIYAKIALCQNEGNYEDIIHWLEHDADLDQIKYSPGLLGICVRAFGETGDLSGMINFYKKYRAHFLRDISSPYHALCILFIFSFCGDTERVNKIFGGPLKSYPETIKAYWRAIALMTRGEEPTAINMFNDLIANNPADAELQRGVKRRIDHPLNKADGLLSSESKEYLNKIAFHFDDHQKYGGSVPAPAGKPLWTYFFITINCLMFITETYLGGSTSPSVLVSMGALIPEFVLAGEWWRVISANFLHFGYLHLVLNMLALYYLGPYLEFAIGRFNYILCYFFTGVMSMTSVVVAYQLNLTEQQIVIGASGCLMGLIGATAAVLLKGYRDYKSRVAYKRLIGVGMIIALQIAFDISVPQISMTVHFLGLVFGFLLTLIMRHRVEPCDAS